MTKDKQDGRPSCQKPVQQGAPVASGARASVVVVVGFVFCLWYFRRHFTKTVTWPGLYVKGVSWLAMKETLRDEHNGALRVASFSKMRTLNKDGASTWFKDLIARLKLAEVKLTGRSSKFNTSKQAYICRLHSHRQAGALSVHFLLSSCFSLIACSSSYYFK